MADAFFCSSSYNGVGNELFSLDPPTATTTLIGPTEDLAHNPYSVRSMCFQPGSGDLYGITQSYSPTNPGHLVRINSLTAVVVDVGQILYDPGGGPISTGNLCDICFDGSGILYAIGPFAEFSIDELSGTATDLSNSPNNDGPADDWTGGHDVVAGPVFYADGIFSQPPNDTAQFLVVVNEPFTLNTFAQIGQTYDETVSNVVPAMKFDSAGTLWAIHMVEDAFGTAELITIDIATGAPTAQGSLPDGMTGIAILKGAATDIVLWVAPWWPAGFSPPPSKRFKPIALITTAELNPVDVTAIYAAHFGQPPSGSVLWVICRSLSDTQQPNRHSPRLSFTVP